MRAANGGAAAIFLPFLPVLLFLLLAGGAATGGLAEGEAALAEGNRLFERDEVEAALAAYARGYTGDRSEEDGVLAYNAGTCALRLGRLPEALLWYRRAEAAIPGDPWLRDNLELTRLELGRRALGEAAGRAFSPGRRLAGRRALALAGVALAWAALALLVFARRRPRGLVPLVALLACAAFAAGPLLDRFGPRAAVLLAACPAQGGGDGLPAGSEVWARPLDGGGWRIVGVESGPRCPAAAVGLLEP